MKVYAVVRQVGPYELRDDVTVALFATRDLAKSWIARERAKWPKGCWKPSFRVKVMAVRGFE